MFHFICASRMMRIIESKKEFLSFPTRRFPMQLVGGTVGHLIRQRFPTFFHSGIKELLPFLFDCGLAKKEDKNRIRGFFFTCWGSRQKKKRKYSWLFFWGDDALQDDVSSWVVLFIFFLLFFWRQNPIENGLGRVTLERRRWRWRS